MTGRHAWRQDAEGGLIYATLHAKQHAFSFREEAIAGQVAFLHDPEGQLRKASLLDERLFFAAHYVPTAVHGLFIAGEWLLLPGGPAPTTLELPGARLAWAFPESAAVTADGLPLRPGQPLRLTRTGAQSLAALTSEGPALVYVERDAGTLQHPAGMGVDPAAQCDLQVLGASYGGKLTLLAVARWRGAEQDTYRVFWRKDTAAPLPVAAFHHLMDASAAYVAGVNVTPGGGWCAAEEMPVGTVFSYAVQLPHAAAGAALHVGLYDRSDWKRRLPCPGGTWTKVTFD